MGLGIAGGGLRTLQRGRFAMGRALMPMAPDDRHPMRFDFAQRERL